MRHGAYRACYLVTLGSGHACVHLARLFRRLGAAGPAPVVLAQLPVLAVWAVFRVVALAGFAAASALAR